MELIVLIGLQATGKSSFYRQRFAATHTCVSKDQFPNNRNKERRQRQLIEASFAAGKSVVVDNTHPTPNDRAAVIDLGRAHAAQVIGYYFQSKLSDSLQRNSLREGKARVPDVGIFATVKKLILPAVSEGFHKLHYVRIGLSNDSLSSHGKRRMQEMETDDLEKTMREREMYHSLRLLPGAWTVIRADGRTFSRFTEKRFEKPFDERFRDLMVTATQALLREFNGIYAYTESDEISVLFPPDWDLFSRELEKIVSLSASVVSSAFTKAAGEEAHFDSRVWMGASRESVIDYFRWRQSDATRCALNGWCYWTLRKAGKSVAEATRTLEEKSVSFKNELLFQHGINFNDLPLWQRRGIGMYWEDYEREGFNPVKNEKVMATRRRLKIDEALPMKDDYASFLNGVILSSVEGPATSA